MVWLVSNRVHIADIYILFKFISIKGNSNFPYSREFEASWYCVEFEYITFTDGACCPKAAGRMQSRKVARQMLRMATKRKKLFPLSSSKVGKPDSCMTFTITRTSNDFNGAHIAQNWRTRVTQRRARTAKTKWIAFSTWFIFSHRVELRFSDVPIPGPESTYIGACRW